MRAMDAALYGAIAWCVLLIGVLVAIALTLSLPVVI